MIRHVALVLLCVMFAGCGDVRPPSVPTLGVLPEIATPAKSGETNTEKALREARDSWAKAKRDLAAAGQRITDLEEDKKREDRERVLGYLRACLLWVSGLALLGGLACVVLAVVSPVAKPTLARLGIGCACLLVICAGMLWCLPWLPVAGVVLLVSLVACGLIYGGVAFVGWFGRHMNASVLMADGFHRLTEATKDVVPEVVQSLQIENRGRQLMTRAHSEGDKLLAAAAHLRAQSETETPNV